MPLHRGYEGQVCSIADALDVVGERWTLLIVRDLMMGVHRFDALQRELGIARNVLDERLTRLTERGVVERRAYQSRPPRYEYRLTEDGLALWPVIVAMMQWGDARAERPGGPPVLLEHRGCGGRVDGHLCCSRCGERLGPRDVWAIPGESAPADHPLRQRAERHKPAPASGRRE